MNLAISNVKCLQSDDTQAGQTSKSRDMQSCYVIVWCVFSFQLQINAPDCIWLSCVNRSILDLSLYCIKDGVTLKMPSLVLPLYSPLVNPFSSFTLYPDSLPFSLPNFTHRPLTSLSSVYSFIHWLLSNCPSAAIHSLKLSRTHVDWHSVDEVYLYSDATTSKIARTVTQKLGFSKGL